MIRFGQQGAKTAGKPKKGESEAMKKKRSSFKARHSKNIAKGKTSAAYWANKQNGKMPKDACYKKVKARVKVFPSARASQQIAKCRKSKGQVRKTAKGSSLKDGDRKSGRIPKVVSPADKVERMNIADPRNESRVKRQRQNLK